MLRIHASGIWKVIERIAMKAARRSAAVAYLTSERHVRFETGDLLIVDASDAVIAGGGTSATILDRLHRRGVRLYSIAGLHAKVYLFDTAAVIGSANLSVNSSSLIEVAVVTDQPDAVSGVAFLIESLRQHPRAKRIGASFVERALAIPVAKRRVVRGGIGDDKLLAVPDPRTWIIGVSPVDEERFPTEKTDAAKGTKRVAKLLDIDEGNVEWIRYPRSWRFAREARAGDNVIQIWRETSKGKVPASVYRPTPIVDRQDERTCARFFVQPQEDSVSWTAFLKQWQRLGYSSPPGINAERLLPAKHVAALAALWD